MSKNLIFKVLTGVLFIAVAVIWLLSVIYPETFGQLNLSWIIAILAGGLGVIFILKGMFQKNLGFVKKFNIFVGAAFIIAAVLALVGTFIEESIVLPVIAIVVTAAILLSVLVVGGKKWDHGDNQSAGYKNYYERKKEEEEQNKK